jgi:hypothetical protein
MLEIISPITGERLQVVDNDFEEEMTWEQAIEVCKNLGDGWRLPTKLEMEVIYSQLHENGIGNFEASCYWSSTEYNLGGAWLLNFGNGDTYGDGKNNTGKIRAVRVI